MTTTERARAYLSKLPPSIKGCRGSDALFEAAQSLVRGFGFSEADAFPLLLEWNATHATPPWSERELRHKLQDADRSSRRPAGYLLDDKPATGVASVLAREQAAKQAKRDQWPAFQPLSARSVDAICTLRGLHPRAVEAAIYNGYLVGGPVDGHRSFILREGVFAQARRFDGQPFEMAGKPIKAKTLPGSEGQWIGWRTIGRDNPILIVEGAIGLLEAMSAMVTVDADHNPGWTALAAVSASSRFTGQDLHRLKGRRVRIVMDGDSAGAEAAAVWAASLNGLEITADVFRLPGGLKDIGDALSDTALLREIFAL